MSGIYHEWNGTTLTITSDSGTSSADLKGEMGVRGAQGAAGLGGNDEINFYKSRREEITATHDEIKTAYIMGLYEELRTQYPDEVKRFEYKSDDGTFTNYSYLISTGEYNERGTYGIAYIKDSNIKKRKYAVLSGIHGTERKTALSTYRFVKDFLEGYHIPRSFKESVVLSVFPVGAPSAFDAFTRENEDGVNINRNFPYNWSKHTYKEKVDGVEVIKEDNLYGNAAADAKETQAIMKWLNDNTDAELFIDFHNNGASHELALVLGSPNVPVVERIKRAALKGIERVTPYWKDTLGYTEIMSTDLWENPKLEKIIYGYTASIDLNGVTSAYAEKVLGIPAVSLETVSSTDMSYHDWLNKYRNTYPTKAISIGAEALGNILLEIYTQSLASEVNNEMMNIDNRLSELLDRVNSGFHVESGTVTITDGDLVPGDETTLSRIKGAEAALKGTAGISIKVPCSSGAMAFKFYADDTTRAAIESSQGISYSIAFIGSNFATKEATGLGGQVQSLIINLAYMEAYKNYAQYNYGWIVSSGTSTNAEYTDGAKFTTKQLKAGTYKWEAYYWN